MADTNHNKKREREGFWHRKVPISIVIPIVVVALIPEILRYFQTGQLPTERPTTNPSLGIDDLVREVKTELIKADEEAKENKETSLFDLEDFEMELNFVVSADSKTKGAVHTELVTAESSLDTGSKKVQKLTLHWKAATMAASTRPAEITPISNSNLIIVGSNKPATRGTTP